MKRIFSCPISEREIPVPQCFNDRLPNIRKDVQLDSKASKVDSEESSLHECKSKKCCDLFNDFCENTSIHGVKYFGGRNRPNLERGWWIISFFVSITLCSLLIHNLWLKWDETPVFVSFAEHSTPVWEIPFPAVTICPETKAQKALFNYTDIYHRIDLANSTFTKANLTEEESKNYEAITQVCDAHLSEYNEGNETSNGWEIVDTLQRLQVTMNSSIFSCKWRNDFTGCNSILSPILTEEGMCLTFNTLNAKETLRMENMHEEYNYMEHNETGQHWTLESGYSAEASLEPYPKRVLSAGARAGLIVLLPLYKQDLDYICRGPVQGFKIHLHTPGEVPRVSKQYFRVPINQEVIVAVKPNMMTTSKGLRGYNPNRRQCYFNGERYLRFFQVYTQQNCEFECLTNYTLTKCGCVKFSMPRDGETPVCGAKKVKCYNEAEDDHLWNEFSDGLRKETRYSHGGNTECNCLPSCTSITYDAELSQAEFDWERLFNAYNSPTEEFPGVQFARFSIYFKEAQFITSKRSELYGPTDFLANCGGLLGLFMGVSLLSLVEIVYYLTVRLCCPKPKSVRVEESSSPEEPSSVWMVDLNEDNSKG